MFCVGTVEGVTQYGASCKRAHSIETPLLTDTLLQNAVSYKADTEMKRIYFMTTLDASRQQ